MHRKRSDDSMKIRRLVALGAVFTLFAGVLLTRLAYVQTVRSSEHAGAIARQSVRRIRLNPVRGRMFSSDGDVLVDNAPSFDVVFHVGEMRRPGVRANTVEHIVATAVLLAERLGRPPPLDGESVQRHLARYPALPMTVFRRLSQREHAIVAEWTPPITGLEIQDNFVRTYPHDGIGTHVLGFTGRVNPVQLVRSGEFSYVTHDLQGRDGLERVYDTVLGGRPGMKLVRVDTLGYVHRQIGDAQPPVDGWNLALTLDRRAQQIAERELAGHTGALVLLDVRTGGVIAMASAPTYRLGELTARRYAELARDEVRRPLINRAVSGGYQPGSILKPLIGLAALKAGTVEPTETIVTCTGRYPLGNIGCWLRSGHGNIALREAIEQSCNSYFIDIALETGLDNIRPMLLAAGLGRPPKIDLPHAGGGFVPSRGWAARTRDYGWIAVDTAFLSIGQGPIGMSPLQAAMTAAALGNGGTVFQPHLVREIRDSSGNPVQTTIPTALSQLPASRDDLELIREGMYLAVNGDHATAQRARNSAISLAGKTGTAEVKRPGDEYTNAWFIGYGPVDDPRYAIAIVIERGGSGGRTAAPIAGRFFEQWLAADRLAGAERP